MVQYDVKRSYACSKAVKQSSAPESSAPESSAPESSAPESSQHNHTRLLCRREATATAVQEFSQPGFRACCTPVKKGVGLWP